MMIESQKELITQYKSQTEESIKSIKKKIKTTKKKITQFETNQRQIIKYYKMKKNGKDLNKWTFKNYPFAHHGLSDRNKLTFFTYYDKDVDIYQYSCFVDSELKKLRHRLGQLKFALHRNKEKLNKLNVPKEPKTKNIQKPEKPKKEKKEKIKKNKSLKEKSSGELKKKLQKITIFHVIVVLLILMILIQFVYMHKLTTELETLIGLLQIYNI